MSIKVKTTMTHKSSSQDIFQAILTSRGYKTSREQDLFLHPPDPTLPYLLKESGIKKSVLSSAKKIIDNHLKTGHDICVFGDYDADGVTATAIMWQAVVAYAKQRRSISRILPFIPDRHKHGYGLSDQALKDILSGDAFASAQFTNYAPKLILTVDTGIVAHSAIQAFSDSGIDVIVTDHHLPEGGLPKAKCVIHSLATSGAGVAWIFAMYLLGNPALKLLDLATIGVVGDMMPLSGLNRAITVPGLKSLSTTKRAGLVSLKSKMGITAKNLTTYDISFGIAPRINAAGRIYNPLDALRLLCTSDAKQAQALAEKIESHNKDRQEYTNRALILASKSVTNHKIIVIKGDYHEGVIGLVAGKLTQRYNLPALVMSDNGNVIKGSARSIRGVNITKLLRSLSTPFLGLGGHDQAAGFSITKSKVPQMIKEIVALADKTIHDRLLVKHHHVDIGLPLSLLTMTLAKLLSTLEPFGMANPKPNFLLQNLVVLEDRKLGVDGKHRKLLIEQQGATAYLMLFNADSIVPPSTRLQSIKALICTLDINVWQNKESLNLIGSYVEA